MICLTLGMVKEVTGSYVVEYSPSEEPGTTPWQVDFTPPFRRVNMIAELEKKLNVTFPLATEFDTPGKTNCVYFVRNVLAMGSVF